MRTPSSRNLIKIAQEGDKLHADMAINDILADIMMYRMNSALGKYRNGNYYFYGIITIP